MHYVYITLHSGLSSILDVSFGLRRHRCLVLIWCSRYIYPSFQLLYYKWDPQRYHFSPPTTNSRVICSETPGTYRAAMFLFYFLFTFVGFYMSFFFLIPFPTYFNLSARICCSNTYFLDFCYYTKAFRLSRDAAFHKCMFSYLFGWKLHSYYNFFSSWIVTSFLCCNDAFP